MSIKQDLPSNLGNTKKIGKMEYEVGCEPISSKNKDKGDYYNLNIAAFTFGGRHAGGMQDGENNRQIENEEVNMYKNREASMKYKQVKGEEITSPNFFHIGIENKMGSHNSFLSVIIHTFWKMDIFRDFILNMDTNEQSPLNLEKDNKSKLLPNLRSVMVKYMQYSQQSNKRNPSKTLDISKLRNSLAEAFQSRRKFLIDQPDDPSDCYYAFINALHSNFIVISIYIKL
jgi:hypothetical protein